MPETSPELMAHQKEGVAFLLERKSGLLAFEQGLGKTIVAIDAFRHLKAAGDADRLIVVCPNSLKRNWAFEVERFAPELTACIVQGSARERRRTLSRTEAAVVIINYEAARNEIVAIRALMRRGRAVIVLDESHYVKNLRALNTIAAQHFAPLSEYRWLLSGTPVPNSPVDLYSQLGIIAGANAFGSFEGFVARYGDAAHSSGPRAELAERIAPYAMRRVKEQCLDLPEKTFLDLYIELPKWQRRLYEDARDGLIREVRGMSREDFDRFAPTALTRLLRLSQIASNPALVFPEEARVPGKVLHLDRVIEELIVGNDRRVVVWSYYVSTLRLLMERYARLGALALYGEVPTSERQDVVRRFQEDPTIHILVANPAAGGVGFTLTAASYAIYETLSWRYDLYAQSQDRIHRIGQTMPVTYIRMVAEDTIEQVIADALSRKADMARSIMGDELEARPIKNMSPEEFCEMLQSNTLPLAKLQPASAPSDPSGLLAMPEGGARQIGELNAREDWR